MPHAAGAALRHPRTTVDTAIEIRPGEGGAESEQFADELAAAIEAHLRRHGHTATRQHTRRAITLNVGLPAGHPSRHTLQQLSGIHRAQRDAKKGSKRHTATAQLAVIDNATAGAITVDDNDLDIDTFRSGGNGGQHAQKNSTAVRIRHTPSGLVAISRTERSQWRNIQLAKAELERQLQQMHDDASTEETNTARRQQGATGNHHKGFTHNTQRDEVIDHTTGKRWPLRAFNRGRFE